MMGKKKTHRLDPEHKVEDATDPDSTAQTEEHHPDVHQFEREFGAHNRERKSGWNASDETAESENEEEQS
jgi:hypothetical protein